MSSSLLPTPSSLPPEYFEVPPSFSSEPVPDYSNQLLEDEVLLERGAIRVNEVLPPASGPTQASYTYTSSNLTLNLGPRAVGQTIVPSYGRGSALKGTIKVDCNLKQVVKLVMVIEGQISTTALEAGIPRYATHHIVLCHTETLYQPGQAAPPSSEFSFNFTFPESCQGNTLAPLPPSFFAIYPGREGGVRYILRFDLFRKGIRRNDRLERVILYLPSSYPPYRSIAPRALPTTAVLENPGLFYAISTGKTSDVSSSSQLKIYLPRPLSYKANSPIPIYFALYHPNGSSPNGPYKITILLFRTTTFTLFDQPSIHEQILGTTCLHFAPIDIFAIVPSSIKGGRDEGEMAWKVEGSIQISYSIRFEMTSIPNSPAANRTPKQTITCPIELTSHSQEQLEEHPIIATAPAMGLISLRNVVR